MSSIVNAFKVSQRHYDLIIKQGYDNLPYETGGFLGGKKGVITAILPTFNKDWDVNKDVFALEDADIKRAYAFFQKHQVDYYGVYHTHPTGVAYPSEADIATNQRYHFIISYSDSSNPQFNVFLIKNNQPIQLPLTVLSNRAFTSLSIQGHADTVGETEREQDELNSRIQRIITDQPNTYKRMPPHSTLGNSDFSTLA